MPPYQDAPSNQTWFALAIGNSRWHWAMFVDDGLQETWEESHQDIGGELDLRVFEKLGDLKPPIWIASVVPEQARLWADYSNARFLSLDDVPLPGLYPTLGIDRALALWGAIATRGSPALVIDCGTALTFTGANQDQRLVGGAILPGLRLQFEALGQKTALLPTLPLPLSPSSPLPPHWALNTEDAIASGILHTVTAGIQSFVQDWWQQFPASNVVMTGGDSDRLYQCLQQQSPTFATPIILDKLLIFKGIQAIRAISA
ncbi:MAG: pantothenate kinase [Leptolyngbyaceae cyanobacterium bins.302]|nr:pantothenate kinase [Leptolyngbyaceae cyanobacterium bins.302]